MFNNLFKNMFGGETLNNLSRDAINDAKLELFNVRLQKEASEGREVTLMRRIARLEDEQRIVREGGDKVKLVMHG